MAPAGETMGTILEALVVMVEVAMAAEVVAVEATVEAAEEATVVVAMTTIGVATTSAVAVVVAEVSVVVEVAVATKTVKATQAMTTGVAISHGERTPGTTIQEAHTRRNQVGAAGLHAEATPRHRMDGPALTRRLSPTPIKTTAPATEANEEATDSEEVAAEAHTSHQVRLQTRRPHQFMW